MQFRRYLNLDLNRLVELNKTLVDEWKRFDENFKVKEICNWDDLNARERFIHGGPWNDPQTLQIHIDYFLKFGEIFLLEEGDILIGEMEIHESSENIWHLDWIMIDSKYQNNGFGSYMMKKFMELYPNVIIDTEPEDENSQRFYTRLGFDHVYSYYTYNKNLDVGDLQWHHQAFKFTKYVYGVDIPLTYLKFQIAIFYPLSKLFGRSEEILYSKVCQNDKYINIMYLPSSALPNRARIILSSETSLNQSEIRDILKLINFTEPINVYFSYNKPINLQGWNFIRITPFLIRNKV